MRTIDHTGGWAFARERVCALPGTRPYSEDPMSVFDSPDLHTALKKIGKYIVDPNVKSRPTVRRLMTRVDGGRPDGPKKRRIMAFMLTLKQPTFVLRVVFNPAPFHWRMTEKELDGKKDLFGPVPLVWMTGKDPSWGDEFKHDIVIVVERKKIEKKPPMVVWSWRRDRVKIRGMLPLLRPKTAMLVSQ